MLAAVGQRSKKQPNSGRHTCGSGIQVEFPFQVGEPELISDRCIICWGSIDGTSNRSLICVFYHLQSMDSAEHRCASASACKFHRNCAVQFERAKRVRETASCAVRSSNGAQEAN